MRSLLILVNEEEAGILYRGTRIYYYYLPSIHPLLRIAHTRADLSRRINPMGGQMPFVEINPTQFYYGTKTHDRINIIFTW